jgi:hypothetical protein
MRWIIEQILTGWLVAALTMGSITAICWPLVAICILWAYDRHVEDVRRIEAAAAHMDIPQMTDHGTNSLPNGSSAFFLTYQPKNS